MRLKSILFISISLCSLAACSPNTGEDGAGIANVKAIKDTTVTFMWRENSYEPEIEDSVSTIFINEDYCNTISDAEKAALGFAATFMGSDCVWDDDEAQNLKCEILTSLDLGYQCSEKHLGFLRQWLKNDKKSLEELQNCSKMPNTATVQTTFNAIKISTKGDSIIVKYDALGVNLREQKDWEWTSKLVFKNNGDNIVLIENVRTPH